MDRVLSSGFQSIVVVESLSKIRLVESLSKIRCCLDLVSTDVGTLFSGDVTSDGFLIGINFRTRYYGFSGCVDKVLKGLWTWPCSLANSK